MIPPMRFNPAEMLVSQKVGRQSEAKRIHSIATEPKLQATQITILICKARRCQIIQNFQLIEHVEFLFT